MNSLKSYVDSGSESSIAYIIFEFLSPPIPDLVIGVRSGKGVITPFLLTAHPI